MQPFQSDFIHAIPQFFHSYIDLPKCMFFKGDPKTKFLLLFLFAVRPPVRPKKFFLTLPLRPTSAIRPGANTAGPILYDVYTLGQNTVWPQVGRRTGAMSGEVFNGRSEGSRTAEGIVGRRTDGSFYLSLEAPFFALFHFPVSRFTEKTRLTTLSPLKIKRCDIKCMMQA